MVKRMTAFKMSIKVLRSRDVTQQKIFDTLHIHVTPPAFYYYFNGLDNSRRGHCVQRLYLFSCHLDAGPTPAEFLSFSVCEHYVTLQTFLLKS
jgi:hypothetical protein